LKIYFECVTLVICGRLSRPMKDKESASWVKDTRSHKVLGEVDGTVQVNAGVRDSYGGERKKAGKVVTG
nr:hypothetical protein [Tanacetum cinerariifolium]